MTTTARKYTPEQVSALSDKELNKAVAECVFGGFHYLLGKFYVDNGTRRGRIVSVAEPSSMLFVLEHMRQRWTEAFPDVEYRPRWSLDEEESGEWSASVVSRSCDPEPRPVPCRDCWRLHAEATAASLGRAIFECALLSIRLTQERPTGYPQ